MHEGGVHGQYAAARQRAAGLQAEWDRANEAYRNHVAWLSSELALPCVTADGGFAGGRAEQLVAEATQMEAALARMEAELRQGEEEAGAALSAWIASISGEAAGLEVDNLLAQLKAARLQSVM
eukprot:gnl/Hemi2/26352_TR8840_c0_g1_i1.p1 gnl/Hemi2/26352_TR8840_c0_g1~~gnl/Hemi2/26352_TR8840_c0_g1_i1.p1  ORF type:complete len:123 (-),score=34.79 gnl/Hemi2/26352_TR8840_c0_g1_i1:146-514(-)